MGGSSSNPVQEVVGGVMEVATGVTDAVGLTNVREQKRMADALMAETAKQNEILEKDLIIKEETRQQQLERENQRLEEEKMAAENADRRESAAASKRRQTLLQSQSGGRSGTILTSPLGLAESDNGQGKAKTLLGA